jgi:glycerol kinase
VKSVLAIDQGTTGSTAVVVNQSGEVLSKAYSEFTQHFPKPGWVEHDPVEIWNVTLAVAREAIAESKTMPTAVGITNQRETVVVWDKKTGQPLHPAIVWQDRRTADACRAFEARYGKDFLTERTGLPWDPYFSGSKVRWLLDNVDGLAGRAEKGEILFGTIDTWLIWKLSNGASYVTDHTNASRTMFYNLAMRSWDPELLEVFGVPRATLPDIVESAGEIAVVASEHFGVEIPISGVAGDQQAALYGQGCTEPGHAKCTFGTGAFLLYPIGDGKRPTSSSGLLTTIACAADGSPMLAAEGSIFIAGAAVQWLRDGLGLVKNAAETEAIAAALEDNGGVFFVPAFVGLGAPHWEADARGMIVGLTRGTTRAHLVRAALEAMAYGTRDLVEAVGSPLVDLKVDGGAAANRWLMQFLADVLQVPVSRPDVVETTALGAAGLAGVASGVWGTSADFVAARTYESFEPGTGSVVDLKGWHQAVGAAVDWAVKGRNDRPGT